MGILGLNNFLLRNCPEIIREIPTRFRALEGGTIALDGTLITQRFHYGSTPHASRHVLGWYRLISEIRRSGMQAVCVFDGNYRQPAKARELTKRDAARRLITGRAHQEISRSRRLAELSFFVDQLRQLGSQARLQLAESIQRYLRSSQTHSSHQNPCSSFVGLSPIIQSEGGKVNSVATHPYQTPPRTTTSSASRDNSTDPISWHSPAGNFIGTSCSYREWPGRSSMGSTSPPGGVTGPGNVALSKLQIELEKKESELRDILIQELELPLYDFPSRLEDISQNLQTLVESAERLRNSYQKRMEPPRVKVYEECKSILIPLGVPVLEADGHFEAEALASSLVLNKMADFVGSEDSDVLLYEVPLLRNITNKGLPLSLIDGAEVRNGLQLSKPAYVDFALLLGSDFSTRMNGLGPQTAIKLIRSFGSIEAILQDEKRKTVGRKFSPEPKMTEAEYLEEVIAGRKAFSTLPSISQTMKDDIHRGQEQESDQEVYDILKTFDLGWSFREHESQEAAFIESDFFSSQHPSFTTLEGNYS